MNILTNNKKSWDLHYQRKRSQLFYPDENLVRLLSKYLQEINDRSSITAFDLGCGSGRHLKLLDDLGVKKTFGLDVSFNALKICKEHKFNLLIQALNHQLPFKDNSFDLGICWGGLHYADKDNFKIQISEIFRVLAKGGYFIGTLRSTSDTMLRKGKDCGNNTWITDLNDINSSIVSFYSEKELISSFNNFSTFEYGLIERTMLGNIEQKISHWYYRAIK